MTRRTASLALLLFCLPVWTCQGTRQEGDHSEPSGETVYASNGARIFYTSTTHSGAPILASEEFGEMPRPPLRSCADCHGPDGAGLVIRTDSGTLRTPPIYYSRLSSPGTYAGGRAYDEASLALTLRTGVRVDGYLLSPAMPRWTLSSEDARDLILHLKSLGPSPSSPSGH